ncbi:hypothetical protein IAS59_003167 [Cryptococcus gattii]
MKKQLTIAECDRILTGPGSPMETEEKVIFGRRLTVWKHLPSTFRDFLIFNLQKYSQRGFISSPLPLREPFKSSETLTGKVNPREHLTFGDVLDRSLKLAAWMRSRGVRVGDRVVIGGKNCTGWIVSFIAAHLIGAVTVCLNCWVPREQMVYSIKMVEPSLVLLDEERAEILGPFTHVKETGLPPMFCWAESGHLPSVVEIYSTPNNQGTKEILDGIGLDGLGPESDAVIFYSSGTSGYPKAVLSTQRMALSNAISGMVATARALLRAGLPLPQPPKPTDPQRVVLLSIPLFHVTGCLSWLLRAITNGSKFVTSVKWDVKEAVRLIVEEGVHTVGGVPAVASQILQSPDLPDNIALDSIFYGGAPPSKHMASEVRKRWPKAAVVQGYGLTETNAVACAVSGADYLLRPDSTGPPVPICEIRIVDPDTRKPLPTGQQGLILIKGAQVMKCYYGNEEATRQAIDRERWFDTGDAGYLDEEGFLFIKDRLKDLIIRGGENIASMDVENALTSHPHIDEVAAIALPHPILGEVVGAAVTLRESAKARGVKVTEESILGHVRSKLPKHAVPVMVMIWEEALPKNVNGKTMKKEIKNVAVQEWERRQGMNSGRAKGKL